MNWVAQVSRISYSTVQQFRAVNQIREQAENSQDYKLDSILSTGLNDSIYYLKLKNVSV